MLRKISVLALLAVAVSASPLRRGPAPTIENGIGPTIKDYRPIQARSQDLVPIQSATAIAGYPAQECDKGITEASATIKARQDFINTSPYFPSVTGFLPAPTDVAGLEASYCLEGECPLTKKRGEVEGPATPVRARQEPSAPVPSIAAPAASGGPSWYCNSNGCQSLSSSWDCDSNSICTDGS